MRGRKAEAELLLRVYRLGLTARAIDERLWILARQGRVNFVLTARGHEVAQVACGLAIRPGQDSAWLYYRDLALGLALGISPYEVLLGALARANDPHSGGRQLTAHFSSPRLGIGTVSSVVAGHATHAVGAAYAARVLGQDSVALCSFGDGAASAGGMHEAMNLAGVQRLPVVFVCQNNGYAISVPQALQMPIDRVARRAEAYGMPGLSVDGFDALAVYEATRAAVERARRGEGPSLIEARVQRMTPHSSQDDDAYRAEDERRSAAEADPLPRLRADLIARGVLDERSAEAEAQRIRDGVIEDEQRALAEPEPDPSRFRRWLFAGDPPHPGLCHG
jgi:2-oxoisovalerate dehydrogenase E1 component alpha subunit